MKKPQAVLAGVVLTFGFVLVLHAQTAQQLPSATPYAIVNQDANSRVWERTIYTKAADGSVVAKTNSYTELASGLNYKDPSTGQWKESKEEIDLQPGSDGAFAVQGQHRIYFPGDIFQGLIKEVTPDGLQLQSRPVGLFFADDTNSILIAILTNSVGELVSSNQVVFPNAFEGADASIRYTYRKAGFEQDVIVQGQLPDPGTLGLDPARTRLGVLTVFFDTNQPVVTPGAVDAADGLSDTTLTFGKMKIGRGRAFAIGDTEPPTPPTNATPAVWLDWMTNSVQQARGTPTFKRWFRLDGRNYLMEEVPYRRVAARLSQLPATTRQDVISSKLYAANTFLEAIPARLLTPVEQVSKTKMTRLARTEQPNGLVLDYVTVNSNSGYTFQAGSTYLVSGPCYFGNITLNGGTFIKYPKYNSTTAFIEVDNTITCNTTATSPAIFTACDDNTVGDTITNSTGNPSGNYYANPAIYAPSGVNLSNVRVNYALKAVWVSGSGSSSTLSDSQFVNCQEMLELGDGNADAITLTCNNCLFNGPYGLFAYDNGTYEGGDRFNLNNCTIDNGYYFAIGTTYPYNVPYSINATNCIFANCYLSMVGSGSLQGGYNGFYSTGSTFGSPATTATSNPFTTSGSNNFYLAADYPFRNIGTTGIGSVLLADLYAGTTYTPQAGSYHDNDGTPDLGYHYPLEDGDNDGLPDWWELYWFGTLAESGSTRDANGNTLLYDYQNGLDPNIIEFSIAVTNNYVSFGNVPVQLNVTAGVPGNYAVSVDNTNYAGNPSWRPFTGTNLTVSLGRNQGWHDVWIGLKGPATNATVTWEWKRLNLTLPPVLVITNPVTDVVDEPVIQIYGYCQESLASINYDISNTLGDATGQPSEITDRYYDTNTGDFTTNYFECLDVPLTNGLNTITIHATDLAGNVTTTNFNFTLDYSKKTNPPVVQITWPTNGTQISGSNFTCRGTISDPTATVSTQLVFTNSNTNFFYGGIYTNVYVASVERNGNFWLENLPINAGTNAFTIKVTDAVGNTSVTNISVVQSALAMTIDPVTPDSQLWQPTVNLTGTISDPTYAVWVNGVKGHNNGNGTWSASNVPVNSGGTASFTATAYSPTERQPDGSYGN